MTFGINKATLTQTWEGCWTQCRLGVVSEGKHLVGGTPPGSIPSPSGWCSLQPLCDWSVESFFPSTVILRFALLLCGHTAAALKKHLYCSNHRHALHWLAPQHPFHLPEASLQLCALLTGVWTIQLRSEVLRSAWSLQYRLLLQCFSQHTNTTTPSATKASLCNTDWEGITGACSKGVGK